MRAADSIDACISGPLAMGAAWVMNGSAASAGGTVPGSLPERLNDCWVEPPGASVDWRGAGVSDVRGPCSAPEEDRGAGDCDERGTAAPLVPEGEVEGGGEADEALAGGGVNENITVVRGSGTSPPRGICPTTSGAWRGSGVTLTITELQSSSRLAGLAPSEGLGDTEPSGAMGAHSKGFSSRGEGLAIVGSITFVGSWARSSTARWLCGSSFRACSKSRRAPSTSPESLSQMPASTNCAARSLLKGHRPMRCSTPLKRLKVRFNMSMLSVTRVASPRSTTWRAVSSARLALLIASGPKSEPSVASWS